MWQSLAFGGTIKLLDEVCDLNVSVPPLIPETLKSLIVMLFVLLSNDDVLFTLSMTVIGIGSWLVGGVDTPYWQSLIVVAAILLVLGWKMPERWDGPLLFWGLVFVIAVSEALLFPEEASMLKTASRIATVLVGTALVWYRSAFADMFGDIRFMEKVVLAGIGYCVVSIGSQTVSNWTLFSTSSTVTVT